MKKLFTIIVLILATQLGFSQHILQHTGIVESNVDLSGPTSVGEVTIAPTVTGKAVVKYDGVCLSDPGNFFEISVNTEVAIGANWSQLYPVSEDLNRNSFSQTRVFDVEPGTHTFHAVSLVTGTNTGSIYGSLTVEFFPENEYIVKHSHNEYNFSDLADVTEVESFNIDALEAGKVIVQFDGTCIVSPGDRIILAASDGVDWTPNEGNVSVEAGSTDNNEKPFSHTRVYSIDAGSHDFYGVIQNFVETDGDGSATIYGGLTVVYIPNSAQNELVNNSIVFGGDLENTTALGQVSIDAPSAGKVKVSFNGVCTSDVGDRIIMAASNDQDWSPNDGNIAVEAESEDLNRNSFSHTRVYDVDPGINNFYAVAQNFVETEGDGSANIYGNLIASFVPSTITSVADENSLPGLEIYPNPAINQFTLKLKNFQELNYKLIDVQGKTLKEGLINRNSMIVSISEIPDGMYTLQIMDQGTVVAVEKVVKTQ